MSESRDCYEQKIAVETFTDRFCIYVVSSIPTLSDRVVPVVVFGSTAVFVTPLYLIKFDIATTQIDHLPGRHYGDLQAGCASHLG